MPQKATLDQVKSQGETEQPRIVLLSELLSELLENGVDITALPSEYDAITIAIPDTGKARFNPSHAQKNDATKTTKACFVIAEIGGSFAGESIEYRQSQGDVQGLPLTVKMSIVAQAPNKLGTTVEEALNRPSKTLELVPETASKTGTDN